MSLRVNRIYSLARRIPAVLGGKTPLLGLGLLTSRVLERFLKQDPRMRARITTLTFDFNRRLAGDEIGIPPLICKAMIEAGVHHMIFSLNEEVARTPELKFPTGPLKATLRFSLRHLSLKGIPKKNEVVSIDFSWSVGPDETTAFQKIKMDGFVRIARGGDANTVEIYFGLSKGYDSLSLYF